MKNWILGLSMASMLGAMGCGEQSDGANDDESYDEGAEGADGFESAEARQVWLPWWRRRDGGFTFPGWPTRDAGKADAGGTDGSIGRCDAGVDPGEPEDAGIPEEPEDAGGPVTPVPDAGKPDAGPVTPPDAGKPDAGPVTPDAGKPDSGIPDAGKPDTGTPVDPCAGLTYANFGQKFMTNYCASCHSAGDASPHGVDVSSLANIKKNADHIIEAAVDSKVMPLQGLPAPTDAERQKLGQWLECGPK